MQLLIITHLESLGERIIEKGIDGRQGLGHGLGVIVFSRAPKEPSREDICIHYIGTNQCLCWCLVARQS